MAFTGLIDYGMGNLLSVSKALDAAGGEIRIVRSPDELAGADRIILPGVGNFHDAMRNLDRAGFTGFLRDWTAADKPFLGICLGLQMLFESSEEAPGVPGLGILKGCCRKFRSDTEKVPHMGWNTVTFSSAHPCFASFREPAWFYFVHSFFVVPDDCSVTAGRTDYICGFTSAVSRGNTVQLDAKPVSVHDRRDHAPRGFPFEQTAFADASGEGDTDFCKLRGR